MADLEVKAEVIFSLSYIRWLSELMRSVSELALLSLLTESIDLVMSTDLSLVPRVDMRRHWLHHLVVIERLILLVKRISKPSGHIPVLCHLLNSILILKRISVRVSRIPREVLLLFNGHHFRAHSHSQVFIQQYISSILLPQYSTSYHSPYLCSFSILDASIHCLEFTFSSPSINSAQSFGANFLILAASNNVSNGTLWAS